MFSKPMYREMLRHLRENGASQVQVAHFNEHWRRANHNPVLPTPCPSCFLGGSVSPLSTLPKDGAMANVCCDVCQRRFEFKEP
jgi:hypothetical protein